MEQKFDFVNIRDIVKRFTTEKRFPHVLGVEKEADQLGKIFLPNKRDKLRVAALLHDITKKLTTDKQIELCNEYGIKLDEHMVPKMLHSKTGCEFARRMLGENIVDKEIYDAIYYHTAGKAGMSLFEAILYLADYIEETRTFSDCVELRNYFYSNIKEADSYEEKIEVLRKTLILSFDMTIKILIDENDFIYLDTINARNYYVVNKDCFKKEENDG